MKYKIFGKVFSFNVNDDLNHRAQESLYHQLRYYPTVDTESKADVVVNIKDKSSYPVLTKLSDDHDEIENGFVIHYLKWSVAYQKKDAKVYCEVQLYEEKNPILYYLKKMNNIEFLSVFERLRQIINENVLLPAIYFFDGFAILHSAAVADKNKSAIMIGGSGGIGKTSLSLRLCRKKEYFFVADDMCVIDSEANLYPNLAFPKIYAYNIRNDLNLQSMVKSNLSYSKRILWQFKKYILGADKVRISLPPDKLYGRYYDELAKVSDYYMLSEKSDSINCEKMDKQEAVKKTLDIMDIEYKEFHRHLLMHQQYCRENNVDPIITKQAVWDRWEKTLTNALSQVNCNRIEIPCTMTHLDKLDKLTELMG